MLGEKKPEKVFFQTFLSWFFIFISFNITLLILLLKIILIQNCKSVKAACVQAGRH